MARIICLLIVGSTALLKLWSLSISSPILNVIHEPTGLRFGQIVAAAMMAEFAVLVLWLKKGDAAFLKACCVLGCIFIAYHGAMMLVGYQTPCPCLGGIMHGSKSYGVIEQKGTVFLAALLAICGVFGFDPKLKPK